MAHTNFKDRNVLITGGASGIGKLMGREVLQRGAKLIIWDRDAEAMEATAAELAALGPVVRQRVDVTERAAVQAAYNELKTQHGPVDILINSAGIVTGNKFFQDIGSDEIDRTMAVNAVAPMHVARVVLPDMVARNQGHLCIIASAASLIGNPRMAVYAASKWAAMGWSESLRIEMKEQRLDIGVTTVAPYYISTGMFAGVRSPLVPILKPDKVVRRIIRGIERRRSIVSMPWPVGFVRLMQAVLPQAIFDLVVGRWMGIYHTMDRFTGRAKP
ncbi:MAG TPA: SDR family NAD(P)-dependent oxidoreductase [Flavobacteriales bacterium]|nr:SDR family NAD(P)-dependent oxidoreductase [Flavobacteriales bacterium]